ncbi:MAG: hypothetical protein ACT4OY_05200 [Alphaproteobacteria bacterium]
MSEYSFEATNGLKVVIESNDNGLAPKITYRRAKGGVTANPLTVPEKLNAQAELIAKLGSAADKFDPKLLAFLKDFAQGFKDEATAKEALKKDASMSDSLDQSLLDAIKTQKISFGGSTNKNDKVKVEKVSDDATGDGVKIGTTTDNKTDPTQFIVGSQSAEKIIEEFAKKPGGISMADALKGADLSKPRDEVFTTQALSNLLHLVRGMQKNDGKYGEVSENAWDEITQKTHAQGGYKEDYEAFKKKYNITGELNSNQAYAFMVYLIKNNESARFNVGKNLFNIADQLIISKNAGNGQGVVNPRDVQSMEVFGNVFEGLQLISRDLRYNQATIDYATKLRGQLQGISKYRWTNTDQEPTVLGGPQPTGLGNETKPTNTTETKVTPNFVTGPDWLTVKGSFDFSQDLGKEKKDLTDAEKASYKKILDESKHSPQGVLHLDKESNRLKLVVRFGDSVKVYDMVGERNDLIGLQNLALSTDTMQRLKTMYNESKGDNRNGYITKFEVHDTTFTNPSVRLWYGADDCGNFRAFFVSKEVQKGEAARITMAEQQTRERIPQYAFLQGKGKNNAVNSIGDIDKASNLKSMFVKAVENQGPPLEKPSILTESPKTSLSKKFSIALNGKQVDVTQDIETIKVALESYKGPKTEDNQMKEMKDYFNKAILNDSDGQLDGEQMRKVGEFKTKLGIPAAP